MVTSDNAPENGEVDLRFIRQVGPDGETTAQLTAGFPFNWADIRVDGRLLVTGSCRMGLLQRRVGAAFFLPNSQRLLRRL